MMRAVSQATGQLKSFSSCIVYTPTMFSAHTFINRSTNQCPAPQSSLIIFSALSLSTRKTMYGLIFSWLTVKLEGFNFGWQIQLYQILMFEILFFFGIQISRCERVTNHVLLLQCEYSHCCILHSLMVSAFVLAIKQLWLFFLRFSPTSRLLHHLHHLVTWNTRNSVLLYWTVFFFVWFVF